MCFIFFYFICFFLLICFLRTLINVLLLLFFRTTLATVYKSVSSVTLSKFFIFFLVCLLGTLTNVLFMLLSCKELGIEAGRCLGAGFWFYLYIRTFTNVLLHLFLVGNNSQ